LKNKDHTQKNTETKTSGADSNIPPQIIVRGLMWVVHAIKQYITR